MRAAVFAFGGLASALAVGPATAAEVAAKEAVRVPRFESVRFVSHKDAGELIVRLSSPATAAPSVRKVGGFVAFSLPGIAMTGKRRNIDASDELFDRAWVLARRTELLLAVRPKGAGLADRSRIESRGTSVHIRMYRTEAAMQAADAVGELERSLEATPTSGASPDAQVPPDEPKPLAPSLASKSSPLGAAASTSSSAVSSGKSVGPSAAKGVGVKAADDAKDRTTALGARPMTLSLRMWAAFGMIVLAIIAGLWFMRRRSKNTKGGSPIRILTAQSVSGGKRHLLLVDVHGERLLLGSAEGGITLLARIDDPDVLGETNDAEDATTTSGAGAAARRVGQGVGAARGGWLVRLREALAPRSESLGPTVRGATPAFVREREDADRNVEPNAALGEPRGRAGRPPDDPQTGEPSSSDSARSPAWTVALSGRGEREATEAAASTADLIRRKLAELNRV